MQRTMLNALVLPILLAGCSVAQTSSPTGPMAFDVVSIRQNNQPSKPFQFQATPTGYRITEAPMAMVILVAYPPSSGGALFAQANVEGLPEWAQRNRYDIEAKVSPADLANWQDPARQKEMLQAMLQTMLAERVKLAVHHGSKEEAVNSLVVAKSGIKMKESVPGEPRPAGRNLPGGAVMTPQADDGTVHFYGIDMATFVALLSDLGGRPVIDETGLTARYDFAIQRPQNENANLNSDAPDSRPTVSSALSGLGLRLEPHKRTVEILVIDHVELPTEN